jgi:hypothetical protein
MTPYLRVCQWNYFYKPTNGVLFLILSQASSDPEREKKMDTKRIAALIILLLPLICPLEKNLTSPLMLLGYCHP